MPEAQRPRSSPIESNDCGGLQATRSTASNGPDWQTEMSIPHHVAGLVVALALGGRVPPFPAPAANYREPPAYFILNAGLRFRIDPDDTGATEGAPISARANVNSTGQVPEIVRVDNQARNGQCRSRTDQAGHTGCRSQASIRQEDASTDNGNRRCLCSQAD